MACINRIIRLTQLRHCATLARSVTLNNAPTLSLIPQIDFTNNPWIWRKNDKIGTPTIKQIQFELPNGLKYVPIEEAPVESNPVDLPTPDSNGPMEAARLIVIRRNKMKRHKLKKLRKRMKYEWAKRRQRRELKKEKAFQAILIAQCKQGEAFSAEKYVEERLNKMYELAPSKASNIL